MPDEQAAPELTITPSRSSAITLFSAAMPGSAKLEVLRKPRRVRAEDHGVGQRVLAARFSKRSRKAAMRARSFAVRQHSFRRRAEAGDAGKIFRAGAQATFLPAAHQLRRERRAVAHDQRARALRPAQLVRGERQ